MCSQRMQQIMVAYVAGWVAIGVKKGAAGEDPGYSLSLGRTTEKGDPSPCSFGKVTRKVPGDNEAQNEGEGSWNYKQITQVMTVSAAAITE